MSYLCNLERATLLGYRLTLLVPLAMFIRFTGLLHSLKTIFLSLLIQYFVNLAALVAAFLCP